MKIEFEIMEPPTGRLAEAGRWPGAGPQAPKKNHGGPRPGTGRTAARSCREIVLDGGLVDLARGEVRYTNGLCCALSGRETDLLRYLAGNAGRVVSRDEILEHVWHLNPERTLTRTIDMHVANLRGKLGEKAQRARLIRTVHGYGYMFRPNGA